MKSEIEANSDLYDWLIAGELIIRTVTLLDAIQRIPRHAKLNIVPNTEGSEIEIIENGQAVGWLLQQHPDCMGQFERVEVETRTASEAA